MISSIMIFFITTLPVSLRRIVAAYEITIGKATSITDIVNDTAILTILLSFNYAVSHFYQADKLIPTRCENN
jgi:hypothetical protein